MKNNNIIMIVIIIIVGAVAFFGGMQYQKSQRAVTSSNGQFGQGGSNGFGRNRGGFGGATVGKILTSDASGITVQLLDGSSKIVNISSTTTITKTSTASASDLKTGQMVAATGASNSDGSITASRIQLNPMIRQGGLNGTQPTPSQ